jgi:hypothetical protein
MSGTHVLSDWAKRLICPKCEWHCSEFDSHFIDCCPKCGEHRSRTSFFEKWRSETMRVVSVPLGKHWWNGRETFWQARRADGNHLRLPEVVG